MLILKKGHQPGVYVPLRALFLVLILCLHITGTLDNCMKKFDAENLIVDKMVTL